MHKRIVIWLTIAGMIFGMLGPLPQAVQAAPNAVPLQQVEPDDYVNLSWNITASGHSDISGANGQVRTVETRNIEIRGSALIRVPKEGIDTAEAAPIFLTIIDELHKVETSPCHTRTTHISITDPTRYSGGPDPFWIHNNDFHPLEIDGKLSLINPFGGTFYMNVPTPRSFTYQEDIHSRQHGGNCGNADEKTTTLEQRWDYIEILSDLWLFPLQADATGKSFKLHKEIEIDTHPTVLRGTADISAQVVCTGAAAAMAAAKTEEEVRAAQNVCGCGALPKNRSIDESHPAINNVQVTLNNTQFEIEPDHTLILQLEVTCDGVPVKNAELEATIIEPQFAGHRHNKEKIMRGYLDNIEITSQNPTIRFRTDEQGRYLLIFDPARDLRDHELGIAGRYDVAVRSVRFPFSVAQAPVFARVRLTHQATSGLYWQTEPYFPSKHLDSKWTTPDTLFAIDNFANAFADFQEKHNKVLTDAGLDAWPLTVVRVGAISLPWGGLFDTQRRALWYPPFEKHTKGGEVLFLPPHIQGFFPDELVAQAEPLLRAAHERIGSKFGTWYTDWDRPLNLVVTQADEAYGAAVPDAVGADLGVTAFRSDPLDGPTAVAGQQVTYTFSVDNYFGDTNANNSALSVQLPQGLSFVSANPVPASQAGQQIEWAVGTVEPVADIKIFQAVLQVAPGVAAGSVLTLTAEVSTSSADATPADNQTAASGLLIVTQGPDLAVEAEIPAAAPGDPVTFPVTVSNDGNATATAAALEVILPDSATFQSASIAPSSQNANRLTWDLGALTVEATSTISITLLLGPDLTVVDPWEWPEEGDEPLTYQLEVSGAPQDIEPSNNLMELEQPLEWPGHDASVLLGVEGAKAPGLLTAGEEVTYTIAYGNRSQEVAANAVISLSLWSGLEFLSSTPAPTRSATSDAFGGGVKVWEMGDLSDLDQGVIQVRVRANEVPQFGNFVMAEIQAQGSDRSPVNNYDTTSLLAATASEEANTMLFMPMLANK